MELIFQFNPCHPLRLVFPPINSPTVSTFAMASSHSPDVSFFKPNAYQYGSLKDKNLSSSEKERRIKMFFHVQKLINEIIPDEPDPAAANALQEGVGGQFGEMRTMMQNMFQSFNIRGTAKPYLDLIQAVGGEEISHAQLIGTT